MMLRNSFLIIFLCLFFCLTINSKAYPFGIEPARIELSIPQNRQKGAMVTVDNSQSGAPLHLKIYVQDIMYLPDGNYDFPSAGSTAWSCANWIRIIPDEIDIPAKKKQSVRISITVPQEARGGYYAMVFFEAGAGYVEGLGINFRIGALVDITVTNTENRKVELANVSFVQPKQIEIDIFNQGNILIRPRGRIKLLDSQGKRRIKQLDFNTQRLSILPGSLRKFLLELDEPLGVGKYILKAEIDYGAKYLLVGELPIEVK